jgi:hypothetical protein
MVMRTALSVVVGTLLVTGCIFPSFDDMQGGERRKNGDPVADSNPTDTTAKSAEVSATATDAATDSPVVVTSADASVDAAPDVATAAPVPKITCGASECPVSSKSYCCAGHDSLPNKSSCQNNDTFDGEFGCSNGFGWALFCDDKADCPNGQLCCVFDRGQRGVAQCATSCPGVILCKTAGDCPNGQACNGGPLETDVPTVTVCGK